MSGWLNNVPLPTARLNMEHSFNGPKCFLVVGGDTYQNQRKIEVDFGKALDMLALHTPEEDLVFVVEDQYIRPIPRAHQNLLPRHGHTIPLIHGNRDAAKAWLINHLRECIERIEKS